ncbi:2,3-bisphosphoglycerate-independent phosphoglycerate mutase 1 [Candidatus Gugararchaeum adminiculabundum]|nr:2,3-bisphosphoglycerate-independent phosphoglycerate mutase 1 [Candidatus Gugararchaeum adminiculabundum]
MKYILVVGDGMSDLPVKALGGKTPLETAQTPNMDFLASNGIAGKFQTIKDGFGGGTDIGHFSIFGLSLKKEYTGRAPIEAAAMGIELAPNDIAIRCNLLNLEENCSKMGDYSAGHITSEEASQLIRALQEKLGGNGVEFYAGVQYRHILVLREKYIPEVVTFPPHDFTGKDVASHMPKPKSAKGKETAQLMERLVRASWEVLRDHPVNKKRIKEGKLPANSIWLWGQGIAPRVRTFNQMYGKSGAIITAVDILRGFATLLGLDFVKVQGATGYFDTNWEGKADAGVKALENHDFVLVHLEAPDEAGHLGDPKKKTEMIENLDKRVLTRIMKQMKEKKIDYRIVVMSDHDTPVETKGHGDGPVPFALWDSRETKNRKLKFCEKNANDGLLQRSIMEELFSK